MQVIYLTFRLLVRENMSQSFYGKEVVKMVWKEMRNLIKIPTLYQHIYHEKVMQNKLAV